MERCEELYCFLYKSKGESDWEIYISFYRSQGTKLTARFPKKEGETHSQKLQKMADMVLYYLNHQDSPYTVKRYEDRLQNECKREPSDYVRISHWDGALIGGKLISRYAHRGETGEWTLVEDPEALNLQPMYVWKAWMEGKNQKAKPAPASIKVEEKKEEKEPIKEDPILPSSSDGDSFELGIPIENLEEEVDPNQVSLNLF